MRPQSDESYYPTPTLQDILNGNEDAYLTAWGQAAASWGHPFFVRLFWEFTGPWATFYYPWSSYNTGAAEFVQKKKKGKAQKETEDLGVTSPVEC